MLKSILLFRIFIRISEFFTVLAIEGMSESMTKCVEQRLVDR